MKLLADKQNSRRIYAFAAVGLISLLVGLGGLFGIDSPYSFGNAAAQEPKPATTARGLPDFVALAKRLKPGVVNISTTQIAQAAGRAESFWPARSIWRSFPSRTIQAEEPRLRLHH